jgi:heat shock protein 4
MQDIESTAVFGARSEVPSVKLISFKDRTDTFQLIARYSDQKALPAGTNEVLGRWLISGLPPQDKSKPPAIIKVRIKLNIHGTLSVGSAQLLEEIKAEDAPATPSPTATAADAKPAVITCSPRRCHG